MSLGLEYSTKSSMDRSRSLASESSSKASSGLLNYQQCQCRLHVVIPGRSWDVLLRPSSSTSHYMICQYAQQIERRRAYFSKYLDRPWTFTTCVLLTRLFESSSTDCGVCNCVSSDAMGTSGPVLGLVVVSDDRGSLPVSIPCS